MAAFTKAEAEKKPAIEELFNDVYEKLPWNLKEQKAELEALLREHPEDYPVKGFADLPAAAPKVHPDRTVR